MAKKEVSKTFPKYVHIDMKGGPPTLPYFLEVMGLVKDWGGTGILVEWEDTFPWTGRETLSLSSSSSSS